MAEELEGGNENDYWKVLNIGVTEQLWDNMKQDIKHCFNDWSKRYARW